jgi:UDP-glucose:(glucosyl)LPS alpha-1,2-glucosyltransferase/UDP-N-acetylglucosamine:(glucosyl)LPS alpha-1,2-N-acetylglucosaminyltransferase
VRIGIFVPHGAIPDIRGFAPAIVAQNFAKNLKFCMPTFISNKEEYSDSFEKNEFWANYRIHQSPLYKRIFQKITRLDPISLGYMASNIAKKNKFDVFHVHQKEFNVAQFKKITKYQIPVVIHAHVSVGIFDEKLGVADRYVAVSNFTKQKMIEKGFPAPLIDVVHNGIDSSLFKKPSGEDIVSLKNILGIPKDNKVVLFAGRKQRGKGFFEFLKIAEIILERSKDITFIAVGPEPYDSIAEVDYFERKKLRAKLSGYKNFIDLPPLPHQKLKNLLSIGDIFVYLSRGDNHSLSIIEAMVTECAVITTDVGGNKESICDQETGLIVDRADNIEMVVSIIEKLIFDENKLMTLQANAKQFAISNFEWEVVSAKMEKIYFDVSHNYRNIGGF